MILDKAFTLEIDLMIGCTSGVQKEFFTTMKSHLKPIEVQSCSAIFDKKDCAWIKRVVQPKQCYRNAYKVGEHFEFGELKPEYVEGKFFAVVYLSTMPGLRLEIFTSTRHLSMLLVKT